MCKIHKIYWIARQSKKCSELIVDRQMHLLSLQGIGLCSKQKKANWIGRLIKQCQPAFSWCDHTSWFLGMIESLWSITSNFVDRTEGVLSPRPFEQGLRNLTVQPYPSILCLSGCCCPKYYFIIWIWRSFEDPLPLLMRYFFFSMVVDQSCDRTNICEMVENIVPGATASRSYSKELSFKLPLKSVEQFPGLFYILHFTIKSIQSSL